ncbi:RsmE family RNA methyltransferase [Euzebya tangerina]|uniref:RsmE family RNA methyltransferase n=1 Tax=Euzebya tangerina TaxID=591198 RepID=UPI0013C36E20|nr:RsmE family RNA methyltransferase [Euzebya tangerina]
MSARPGLPTHGHHVFVPQVGEDRDEVLIRGDAGHHLRAVLRVRTGEPLSLADNSGAVWQGRVQDLLTDGVVVGLDEHVDIPPATPAVTVIQSMPKGRKMEEVVTRLSEVGVDRLVPVHSARSVKQLKGAKAEKARERWDALAVAAAQQSRRARLLQVETITPWPVRDVSGVVLWEQATTPLSEALDELDGVEQIVIAVGPEGGWEQAEVADSGLHPVALGQGILRTETAGVVGAALVLHHLGRLG